MKKKYLKVPKLIDLFYILINFKKAQQLGYLNDTSVTSEIYFKYKDVISIESLELQLDDYRNLYYDEYSYKIDEEKYDNNIENDYPGFKKFFECFSRFQDKLNVDYDSEYDYYKSKIFDSDSDSDDESGIDSDQINNIFGSGEDSESDSDY